VDHQLTLVRFAGERLLYRLAASVYADKFVLKGAAFILLWLGEKIPTTDIDLLGSGETPAEELKHIFTTLCGQKVAGDGLGLDFLAQTVAHCFKRAPPLPSFVVSRGATCSAACGIRCALRLPLSLGVGWRGEDAPQDGHQTGQNQAAP